ncbi:MAG: serine/threonine protein kinase, partial [Myxococcaceae bacterium]|nr:serine/threonine protein kinase [Myxococcaceae bacterium]
MSACLAPDVLIAFASGRLTGDALESAEAHLDTCAMCRVAAVGVAELDSVGSGETTPSRRGTADLLAAGTRVGRYEVLEVAGAGGMGVIYRAMDPTLNRVVALKLVRPDRSHGDAAERLLFEAKAMARVVHPEVLPVHDAGTHGEQLFIAMEWVQGRTLRAVLATRSPWRERLALLIRAGRGLAAAHEAGLVHRDFKPENVLVGDDGRVRVSDFGLAHDVDVAEAAAGTAHYMAPEVLAGKAATAAADQYAFCLVLREALSGEGPVALRRIIERGLERDPSSRHPSMAALVAELERVVRPKTAAWAAAAVAAVLVPVAGYAAFVRGSAQPCSAGPGLVAAVWNVARKTALKAVAPSTEAATVARLFDRLDT